MRPLLLLSLLLAPTLPLAAIPPSAPFTVEESGHGYATLAEAVSAIGAGDGTILIRAGSYHECAVQEAGRVAYRAAVPGSVIFEGIACEGKAGFVLRGRAAHVEGIVFRGFRVADRNGAGIRLERGDLSVVQSQFRSSEQGILTAENPEATLSIDRSTFTGLGGCPNGQCSHAAYIGNIGNLIVTRSRFEAGTGGHYLKSRAARVEVTDNSFDDSRGSATNYLIDLPAGSTGRIARNEFLVGPNKENHSALIAVGAEQQLHSSAGLIVTDNHARLAPGINWPTSFVANWTRDPIRLVANDLGPGIQPYSAR
jgi:hypothetical protein